MHIISNNSFVRWIQETDFFQFQDRISTFSKRVFAELGVSLAISLTIMAFTATPVTIPVLVSITASALIAVAVRMIFEANLPSDGRELDAKIVPVSEAVGRFGIVNALGLSSLNIYLHEAGHALAALTCYINPKIIISAIPYKAGSTSFTPANGLTKIGESLGSQNSLMLFRAGGLIASTIVATVEIVAAFFCRDASPQARLTLLCHAISQLFNDIMYGVMALTARGFDLKNDFQCLWRLNGIHPLAAIGCMIAVPLTVYVALEVFKLFR